MSWPTIDHRDYSLLTQIRTWRLIAIGATDLIIVKGEAESSPERSFLLSSSYSELRSASDERCRRLGNLCANHIQYEH